MRERLYKYQQTPLPSCRLKGGLAGGRGRQFLPTRPYPRGRVAQSQKKCDNACLARLHPCLETFFIYFFPLGVQVNVECLLPHMQSICEFMLTAQQDPDPDVSCFAPLLGVGRPPPYVCLFSCLVFCGMGAEEGEAHRQREDTCKNRWCCCCCSNT